MKKTLFLSAILGAALCSSAFAETVTISGTQNNLNLNDAAYAGKDLILNLTGGYFYGVREGGVNPTFSQNIQVGDGSENQGGIIGNNGWANMVTFTGTITGNGEIKKTGAGTNLKHVFTGDVTGYTGNITLGASATFYLCFGAVNDGTASTTQNSTATAGVSGTGDITFTSGSNNLVYNYAASAGTVYITNAIKKDGGTSKVQLLGGASYVLTQASTIDSITFANNSSLKYTGTEQTTVGGQVAAGSTLEGVITNNVSNVKYTGTYGVGSGTLKNVQIHEFDAGAAQGSITLNGVYGNLKNGGTQRNVTLAGAGLILTEGYTNGSYSFQKLDGSGNLEKRFGVNETFTFENAAEWTGIFKNVAGTANLTFNGNSKVDIEGRDTTNVTLKGTDYSGMDITAYNNKTATVTVSNNADTTLHQIINDPWGQTAGHAALVLNNGHKTTISEWATVDSITMKNNSSVQLNYHNVGTLTVESGSSNVFSGAAIGSNNQHRLSAVEVKDSASLTFGAADTTVSAITLGADSSITVGDQGSHKFDLTTTDLTVNGNANINADLVVNGGTLTFADNAILTMGCDVTIGNTVTVVLTDAMVESIMNGNNVEIIAGVDKANLGQSLTFIGSGTKSDYVAEHEAVYSLKQVGDKIYIAPEPATATLSLLALAALAARRKRH